MLARIGWPGIILSRNDWKY